MKKRKELNAALPADMQAVEPCADAAPKAKKPYVKPTMQVFPLNCQLLAGSGVSGPPVQVTLSRMPGIDYYWIVRSREDFLYSGPSSLIPSHCYAGWMGFDVQHVGWDFGCADVNDGTSFLSQYAAKAQAIRDYADEVTNCDYFAEGNCTKDKHGYYWYPSGTFLEVNCGIGYLPTPGLTVVATFAGADWDVEDFFDNARFDACSAEDATTFSGTYNGRRFEGTILDSPTLRDTF
ncbi:MAG: hypothetical protein IJ722_02085 [Alloprevotella sp.]|nr:hypothetical protein [Alloprevotella sp.]